MNHDDPDVRLLPRTFADGRAGFLSTDGSGPVSRLADRIEADQLGSARRVLGYVRKERARVGAKTAAELGFLNDRLADALDDVVRIAESRGKRLAPPDEDRDDERDEESDREWGEGGGAEPYASGVAAFPGGALASAGAARRFVRETARSWRLPPEAADALETIAGELAANALEHSRSRYIVVAVACADRMVRVGVTDEGEGWTVVREEPGAEQERGRGLLIVGAVADRWGTRPADAGGHTVWAEVAIGRRTAAPR
ncbi:ATP-binding protein [Streptomyces sp. NPDC057555]|uniref:ATP-binding protein n=1 Tax=Streptomyces sp. NPDC057555 TaxID=3346166 RepID=UPI0036B009E5